MPDIANTDLVSLDGFKPLKLDPRTEIPRKVHYACGLNVFRGWLNLDFFDDALIWNFGHLGGVPREVATGVYKVDLLSRHPFADNYFDHAFCEDFIEHLHQKDAILFLSEVLRTLKPGGVLRLSTPGLEGVMKAHFHRPGLDAVVANQEAAYTRWGHVHFFTIESLSTIALNLGFRSCHARSFGESPYPVLAGLETRADQSGVNLYAELQN